MTEQRTTDIKAGPGGVMTDEVGVVTGDLTLRTETLRTETLRTETLRTETLRTEADHAHHVAVKVQYKDAAEWYTVTGAKATLADPKDIDAVHRIAVALLNRPEG
jgi:hypothetical protein